MSGASSVSWQGMKLHHAGKAQLDVTQPVLDHLDFFAVCVAKIAAVFVEHELHLVVQILLPLLHVRLEIGDLLLGSDAVAADEIGEVLDVLLRCRWGRLGAFGHRE